MKAVIPVIFSFCLLLGSCLPTTGVFEKNISIPDQQWQSGFRPDISFDIQDTVSRYNVYIVLRHTDAYNFNNLYLQCAVKQPGAARAGSADYDLTLATNEKGWLGAAMDDIYESRLLIQPQTRFTQQGVYHFTIEQLMREDPLKHVLNVGLRIEKIQ